MIGFVADSSVLLWARFRSLSSFFNSEAARSILGLVACCCVMVILVMLRSMVSKRWYIVNWKRMIAMTRINNIKIARNDGLLMLAPHRVIVTGDSPRHLLYKSNVHARGVI